MIDEIQSLSEKIEKQRADKVARLLELLRDPELSGYVAQLRDPRPQARAVEFQPELAAKPTAFTPPIGFKTGNGIRETIRGLALPGRFKADDVVEALRASGFQFASANPRKTVAEALSSLSSGKQAIFRKIKGGVGGQPGVYVRLQNQEAPEGAS